MHPAIKIVSLVIVSIFLTQGGWSVILITGVLLLPFYVARLNLWSPAIKMLLRLKWFFISIFLIYYLYTPQIHLVDQSFYISRIAQFLPGLFRISVLIFILFAVNLFIQTTTKDEILAALLWLFIPLKLFNIKTERIALRAVLTLEYIEALSQRLSDYKKSSLVENELQDFSQRAKSYRNTVQRKKTAFLQLLKHSGIILREILKEADSTAGKSYTIDCLESPRLVQYIFPLALYLIYHFSL